MVWNQEYSALQTATSTIPEEDVNEHGANQSAADRSNIELHIKNVVMPLFNEVAEAVKAAGHYGTAGIIVAQSTSGTEPMEVPFVMGAFLGISRKFQAWSMQCEGSIRLVHASGTIFTLSRKAPDFHVTDGASLNDVSRFHLTVMVREIIESTLER